MPLAFDNVPQGSAMLGGPLHGARIACDERDAELTFVAFEGGIPVRHRYVRVERHREFIHQKDG